MSSPVTVHDGYWVIEDPAQEQSAFPVSPPEGHFVVGGRNVVHQFGPVRDQVPAVVVEVWDGAAGEPDGEWELRDEVRVRLDLDPDEWPRGVEQWVVRVWPER